jgi:hypothetical protein
MSMRELKALLDDQVLDWITDPKLKLCWFIPSDLIPTVSASSDHKMQRQELASQLEENGIPCLEQTPGCEWTYYDVEGSLDRLVKRGRLFKVGPSDGRSGVYALASNKQAIENDFAEWAHSNRTPR